MEKRPANFNKKIDFDSAGFKDLLLLLIIKNAFYRQYDNSLLIKSEMGAQSSLELFTVTPEFMSLHINQMETFIEKNKNQVINSSVRLNFFYFLYIFEDISHIPTARNDIKQIYKKSQESGILSEYIIIDIQTGTYETITDKRLCDRKLEKVIKMAVQTASTSKEQFIEICDNTKKEMNEINKELVGKRLSNSFNAVNAMIFANILIFIVGLALLSRDGLDYFKIYGIQNKQYVMSGEVWRLATSMFLHADFQHLIGNMFFLYLIGKIVAHLYGNKRFIILYLLSGLAGNVASLLIYSNVNSLGASGAIMGIGGVLFFKLFFDKNKALRYLGNYVVLVMVIIFNIASGFISTGIDNAAHVVGFLVGFALAVIFSMIDKGRRQKM